jgi:hypothetical protein
MIPDEAILFQKHVMHTDLDIYVFICAVQGFKIMLKYILSIDAVFYKLL